MVTDSEFKYDDVNKDNKKGPMTAIKKFFSLKSNANIQKTGALNDTMKIVANDANFENDMNDIDDDLPGVYKKS